MVCVREDVPVEHLDDDTVPFVGEFPVRCLLCLRISDRSQRDEVIVRIAALTGRCLLPPVRQRIRLGLAGLVDDEEDAAVGGIPDIHVVPDVRDPPASWHADGETSRIGEPVIPGWHSAGLAGTRRRAPRGRRWRG
jgi:hypothetical protein